MSNARFSILQSRAVGDIRISHSQFRTLAALGVYGNQNGWCFPSLKTLAQTLRKSRQAVSKDVQHLVALGYIEKKPQYREDGGQTSNLYRLVFDLPDLTPATHDVAPPTTSNVDPLTTYNNDLLNTRAEEEFENSDDLEDIDEEIMEDDEEVSPPDGIVHLSKEEYMSRVERAVARGAERQSKKMSAAADVKLLTSDLSSWPEDVRDTIALVCEKWHLHPPNTGGNRPGKQAGYWIQSGRDLIDACGEFGLEAINRTRQEFENYMASHGGLAPYTVASPNSLVNSVRATAAKMREDVLSTANRRVKYIPGYGDYLMPEGM